MKEKDEGDFDPEQASRAELQLVRGGASLMTMGASERRMIARESPRNERRILEQVLDELAMVPAEAVRNYYTIPFKKHTGRGGCKRHSDDNCPEENVMGMSVKAARALARRWGNCDIAAGMVVYEDDRSIGVGAIFEDLETNMRKAKIYHVSKTARRRGGDEYPMGAEQLTRSASIGTSKAERNAILEALPEYLKQAYYKKSLELAAAEVPRKKDEATGLTSWDGAAAGKRAEVHFLKLGITKSMLEKYLRHPLSQLSETEYGTMVGISNGIQDGSVDVESIFDPVADEDADNAEFRNPTAREVVEHHAGVPSGRTGHVAGPSPDLGKARRILRDELMRLSGGDEKAARRILRVISAGEGFDGFSAPSEIPQTAFVDMYMERLRSNEWAPSIAEAVSGRME